MTINSNVKKKKPLELASYLSVSLLTNQTSNRGQCCYFKYFLDYVVYMPDLCMLFWYNFDKHILKAFI